MNAETVTETIRLLRKQIEKELKSTTGADPFISAYIPPARKDELSIRIAWGEDHDEELRLTLRVIDPNQCQNYTILIFESSFMSEKFVDACSVARLVPVMQNIMTNREEYLVEKARKIVLYNALVKQWRDTAVSIPSSVTISISSPTQRDFPDLCIAIDHMAWSCPIERAQPILDAIKRMVEEVATITAKEKTP